MFQDRLFNDLDLEMLCEAAIDSLKSRANLEAKQEKVDGDREEDERKNLSLDQAFLFQQFKEVLACLSDQVSAVAGNYRSLSLNHLLCGQVTASPVLWSCKAKVFEAESNIEQAIECRQFF